MGLVHHLNQPPCGPHQLEQVVRGEQVVRKGRMVAARGKPEFNHVLSVMRLSIRAWPQVVRASNGTIARASRCGFWLPRSVRLDCAEAWRRARAAEWGSLLRSCPLCGGPQVQILSSPPRARSSTDRASDYGSEGWGFESLRARHCHQSRDMVPAMFGSASAPSARVELVTDSPSRRQISAVWPDK